MNAPAIDFDAAPADVDEQDALDDQRAPSRDNGAATPASTDEEITVIELRSPTQTGTSVADSRRRTGLWIAGLAAAAAAAVVLIIGFVVATADDDPTVTAGPAETAPPTGDDVLARRVAVVEELLAVWSEGRVQDFQDLLPDGPFFFRGRAHVQESWAVANEQWTLDGPCEQETSAALVCPTVRRDDFHGAGGLEARPVYTFVFNEANEITDITDAGTSNTRYVAFDGAFAAWFTENHPEAAKDYGPFLSSDPYADERNMPDAEDMAIALQYVDEFVAQSAAYPVDDTNS